MESKSYTERLTGPQRVCVMAVYTVASWSWWAISLLIIQEFVELARRHYENDLTTTDRELLEKAGNRVGLYTTIGASVGLGLGVFLSLRVRRAGIKFYNQAKKIERPVAIQFKDGHTGEHSLYNDDTARMLLLASYLTPCQSFYSTIPWYRHRRAVQTVRPRFATTVIRHMSKRVILIPVLWPSISQITNWTVPARISLQYCRVLRRRRCVPSSSLFFLDLKQRHLRDCIQHNRTRIVHRNTIGQQPHHTRPFSPL